MAQAHTGLAVEALLVGGMVLPPRVLWQGADGQQPRIDSRGQGRGGGEG